MANPIVPCLWFNDCAEEAVAFYMGVFKDGKALSTDRYTEVGTEITGHREGDVVTIEFEIMGTKFLALNAGPEFAFNPSVSFVIECENQEEIDFYWDRLSSRPEAEQCGWCTDKYGVVWQVVPKTLTRMLLNGTREQRTRVTEAYMEMKKFDVLELEAAFEGRNGTSYD